MKDPEFFAGRFSFSSGKYSRWVKQRGEVGIFPKDRGQGLDQEAVGPSGVGGLDHE